MEIVKIKSRPRSSIDFNSDIFKNWLDYNGKRYTLTKTDIKAIIRYGGVSFFDIVLFLACTLLTVLIIIPDGGISRLDFNGYALLFFAIIMTVGYFAYIVKKQKNRGLLIAGLRERKYSAYIFDVCGIVRYTNKGGIDEVDTHEYYIRCDKFDIQLNGPGNPFLSNSTIHGSMPPILLIKHLKRLDSANGKLLAVRYYSPKGKSYVALFTYPVR